MDLQNAHAGLARNHFWSFTLDVEEFAHRDTRVRPAMTIEWIALPRRRWKDPTGPRLEGTYGDLGIESSFYVWEHDYPALRVSGEAWLPYKGLRVPETLDDEPVSMAYGRMISETYVDRVEYGHPSPRGRTLPTRI